jgi:hypothetical protein
VNAIEASKLLAVAAGFDRRKVAEADVIAWAAALHGLSYDDCEQAVIAHYTTSTDWLMPGHVRGRVRAMHRDRINRAGTLIGRPDELADDPKAWLEAYRAQVRAVGDGRLRPVATPSGRRVLASRAEPRAIEGGAR